MLGCLLGPGIHVELLLGEGSTGKMWEVLMMLFPSTSFRDTMNCEPAANGTKLRPMPAVKLISCRGTTIAVELKGMIAKEAGAPEAGEANPVKESSNGEHCWTLVELT